MYIETSSPQVLGDEAILLANAIDISSLTRPELRFFSHMYGADIDSLLIDISVDGGNSFSRIFSIISLLIIFFSDFL